MKVEKISGAFISLILTTCSQSAFSNGSWWLPPSDQCVKYDREERSIDDALVEAEKSLLDLFEVPKSMWEIAENRLEKSSIIKLSEPEAQYYLGENYKVPQGKTPYLVRALYGNGGTGGFSFLWCGEDIWVSHTSLGTKYEENKTALILNLRREPENIYITTGGAE